MSERKDFSPSPEYVAYRKAFDAWVASLHAEPDYTKRPDWEAWQREQAALNETHEAALNALFGRPVESLSDVTALAIAAHDQGWNDRIQIYCWRDVPAEFVGALVLGVFQLQAGDASLRPRPEIWKRSPIGQFMSQFDKH